MLARVPCPVVFDSDALRFGEFANAFRVMTNPDGETVIDFCIYSANDNIAKVVARVRVARAFLSLLDVRIGEALEEFENHSGGAEQGGLLVFPDGSRVLVGAGSEEIH